MLVLAAMERTAIAINAVAGTHSPRSKCEVVKNIAKAAWIAAQNDVHLMSVSMRGYEQRIFGSEC